MTYIEKGLYHYQKIRNRLGIDEDKFDEKISTDAAFYEAVRMLDEKITKLKNQRNTEKRLEKLERKINDCNCCHGCCHK